MGMSEVRHSIFEKGAGVAAPKHLPDASAIVGRHSFFLYPSRGIWPQFQFGHTHKSFVAIKITHLQIFHHSSHWQHKTLLLLPKNCADPASSAKLSCHPRIVPILSLLASSAKLSCCPRIVPILSLQHNSLTTQESVKVLTKDDDRGSGMTTKITALLLTWVTLTL